MRSGFALVAGAVLCLWGSWTWAVETPPKPEPDKPAKKETPVLVPVGAKEGSVLMIEPKTVPGSPPQEEMVITRTFEKTLGEAVKEKVSECVGVSGGGWTWINPGGVGGFGILSFESWRDWDELWVLSDPESDRIRFHAPLGFSMHWWSGPKGDALHPVPDLPARVYDLYLDLNWQPRVNDWLAIELRFAPGLHTDFKVTPPDAFRIRAHALGLITLTPELHAVLGGEFINRNRVKSLPIVGFLWQPHEDLECRLVFPHPKVSYRLGDMWWLYVSGEYGGGTWAYKYLPSEKTDWVEYSDFRVMVGIENRCDKNNTFLEVGYLFERRIDFVSALPDFNPNDTFLVRVGHRF
jgi:hypothetical protein